MKKTILLTIFIGLTSSIFANTNIHLPSQTLPEGISEERFAQLQQEYKSKVNKEELQASLPRVESAKIDPYSKQTAETKRIASSTKRDFENKIRRAWDIPVNSSGKTAQAQITLSENGSVQSIKVISDDPDMKASIETAIRAAAPYPMPSDPDVRERARRITSTFKAK